MGANTPYAPLWPGMHPPYTLLHSRGCTYPTRVSPTVCVHAPCAVLHGSICTHTPIHLHARVGTCTLSAPPRLRALPPHMGAHTPLMLLQPCSPVLHHLGLARPPATGAARQGRTGTAARRPPPFKSRGGSGAGPTRRPRGRAVPLINMKAAAAAANG